MSVFCVKFEVFATFPDIFVRSIVLQFREDTIPKEVSMYQ